MSFLTTQSGSLFYDFTRFHSISLDSCQRSFKALPVLRTFPNAACGYHSLFKESANHFLKSLPSFFLVAFNKKSFFFQVHQFHKTSDNSVEGPGIFFLEQCSQAACLIVTVPALFMGARGNTA